MSLGEPSLLFRFYPHRRQHELHFYRSESQNTATTHAAASSPPVSRLENRERESDRNTYHDHCQGLRGRVTGRFSKLLGALAPAAICLHVHQTPTALVRKAFKAVTNRGGAMTRSITRCRALTFFAGVTLWDGGKDGVCGSGEAKAAEGGRKQRREREVSVSVVWFVIASRQQCQVVY